MSTSRSVTKSTAAASPRRLHLPGEIAADEADHQVEVEGEGQEIEVMQRWRSISTSSKGFRPSRSLEFSGHLGQKPHRQIEDRLLMAVPAGPA